MLADVGGHVWRYFVNSWLWGQFLSLPTHSSHGTI